MSRLGNKYCMKLGTFVLDVDNMSHFLHHTVYGWVNDVVPTSKRKLLVNFY